MTYASYSRIGFAAVFLALLAVRSATVESDTVFFAGTGTPSPVIAQSPLYLKDTVPPLNMLVMGKDHKIYYEAYNDASDLNGDGALDVGYKPATIDYYGYYNSNACYIYESANGGRFVPSSSATSKQCSGKWSGDFLNYLTTSRMDALRRVLYGGWRQVDTATDTTLQGAFFPQDAHSWGKEYQSTTRDGYDISRYAPLSQPTSGNYHLFAVTTLSDNTAPLFRVMQNTTARVWNWLSIEGPVAGNKCFNASNTRVDCISGGGSAAFPGHPGNRNAFDTLETNYAIAANLYGTSSLDRIDCNTGACNLQGTSDEYLTVITGTIKINANGNYKFRVDGDDVVDFNLYENGTQVASAGCYTTAGRGFGTCGGAEETAVVNMRASRTYTFELRQEDGTGGDGYRLDWTRTNGGNGTAFGYRVLRLDGADSGANGNGGLAANVSARFYDLTPALSGGSRRDDYNVRVQVCPAATALQDSTCKTYPNGQAKPTGILHDYGENQKMYFGLITGSQFNNLEGGVLRKNISNFASEIDSNTGQFLAGAGIANALSKLRMIGGGYNGSTTNNLNSDTNWNWANTANGVGGNCPSIGSRAINNGECRMWGNPIAEMMFEGMRYFAGAGAATARFSGGGATEGQAEETAMGFVPETWKNPYSTTGGNYPTCAKPFETVISDINPSYDGDLPGSAFNALPADPAVTGFNASAEGQAIWNNEFGGSRTVFIGDVNGTTDGAPTAKTASSFGNIRGLAPEEPTKGGTYYAASVARYGYVNDLNTAANFQKLGVYSIALASPLPRIEFPVGTRTISILPFAKTASGTFGTAARKPTNTIVDFYVEQIVNLPGQPLDSTVNGGRPYAVFRINYEDVEQGNDHDMDAIVKYEVKANADSTVAVNLTSEYAAGSADQNIGYVMSGSTKDGIYLVVRDTDSGTGSFLRYDFNTPPGVDPGGCTGVTTGVCNQQLPLTSARTFTASAAAPLATELQNPLWYAAKYGGFDDANGNNIPDPGEWDSTVAGKPDNYFLVTNPLQLRAQLSKAFDSIANQNSDIGSAAISGSRIASGSYTLQPSYARSRNGEDWIGNLQAKAINADGTLGSVLWDAQSNLPPATSGARNIFAMITPGVFTSKVAQDFQATNLGATSTLQFAKLGITEAQVPTMYGAAYTPQNIVSYLRGDGSREERNGGVANTLRSRASALGDIVNSEPAVFSPKGNLGYGFYPDAMFAGYTGTGGYLETKKTRTPAVLVGANDGMLHAFNATTMPCTANPKQTCAGPGAGTELFAFIPGGVLNQMGKLALPDALFDHRYYVDGQITIGDAKNGAAWKTLAIGTAGAGGKSIFALDISDPSAVGTSQALWELNSTTDTDIGYMFGKPLLVPLQNGTWGVIFGNGYGGSSSDPSLYIVNAFTGALIKKITASDGATGGAADPYNGLGQITAIDRDSDGKIDTVYGGDLLGNLWKFDLSNATASSWVVAFSGSPLFTATEGTRTTAYSGPNAALEIRQPITGGMRVSAGPGSGQMVFFGTGRYFLNGDNDVPTTYDPQVQTLYGVWDNNVSAAGGRGNVVAQTITSQTTTAGVTTRAISQNQIQYFGAGAKRGWLLDLALNSDGDAALDGVGERFFGSPRVQNGKISMATYTPERNSCDPGGTNFLYALDLISGTGSLAYVEVLPSSTPACTNGDCGGIALNNGGGTQPPVTGTGVVIPNPGTVIPGLTCLPGTPGCTGSGAPTFEECQVVIYPGGLVLPRPCGRQSWRQLK